MKFGNSQRVLIKICRFKEVITNLIIISLELVSLFVTLVLFRLAILRYLSYCDELVKLLWPTLGKVLLIDESEKKKRKVQFFLFATEYDMNHLLFSQKNLLACWSVVVSSIYRSLLATKCKDISPIIGDISEEWTTIFGGNRLHYFLYYCW